MVTRPPAHCPGCGAALRVKRPPTVHHCPECDEFVFYNPTPQARVAVVDDERLLLVEIPPDEAPDCWSVPGGSIEAGEHPHEGAARELAEETGLHVDPEALAFVDGVGYEKWPDVHKVALIYAVAAADVAGAVEADGREHTDARFWTPDAFADAGQELGEFYGLPEEYRDVDWWHRTARAALADDG